MRASLISALVRLEMNNSRSDCGQWLLLVNLCWVILLFLRISIECIQTNGVPKGWVLDVG